MDHVTYKTAVQACYRGDLPGLHRLLQKHQNWCTSDLDKLAEKCLLHTQPRLLLLFPLEYLQSESFQQLKAKHKLSNGTLRAKMKNLSWFIHRDSPTNMIKKISRIGNIATLASFITRSGILEYPLLRDETRHLLLHLVRTDDRLHNVHVAKRLLGPFGPKAAVDWLKIVSELSTLPILNDFSCLPSYDLQDEDYGVFMAVIHCSILESPVYTNSIFKQTIYKHREKIIIHALRKYPTFLEPMFKQKFGPSWWNVFEILHQGSAHRLKGFLLEYLDVYLEAARPYLLLRWILLRAMDPGKAIDRWLYAPPYGKRHLQVFEQVCRDYEQLLRNQRSAILPDTVPVS